MIFYAPNAPIEGVKILIKHQKKWSLPLDLTCFECLSVTVATQFATNEQLKDLTHMFLQIPCYKLYK